MLGLQTCNKYCHVVLPPSSAIHEFGLKEVLCGFVVCIVSVQIQSLASVMVNLTSPVFGTSE